MSLRLVAKILYSNDMILLVRKQLTMVVSIELKLRYIQRVIATKGVDINETIRLYLLTNNWHQSLNKLTPVEYRLRHEH